MTKKSFILGTTTLTIAATASLAAAEVNQPQETVQRPLTTPAAQITILGDLGMAMVPDPIDDSFALRVGARYGVSDKIEAGATYAFRISPDGSAKGPLGAEVAYNIMEGNLAVSANALLGYDLDNEALLPLNLGARVRFRLNDQLAITTGAGGGPLDQLVPNITPGGGQLTISLDGDVKPIYLSVPVGVAFQVNPQIYAYANTNVANIEIADADGLGGFIFADFIPLQVGATFSPSNTMDFGASVGWYDLDNASDFMFLFASARLHM